MDRSADVNMLNPAEHPLQIPTFSQISTVNISPSAKLVSIAGQIGASLAPDAAATPFVEQVRNALARVDLCLSAAGASKSSIIAVRQYVVNLASRDAGDARARGEVYLDWWRRTEGDRLPPPSTLVGVESLAGKDTAYEIEVTCVVHV